MDKKILRAICTAFLKGLSAVSMAGGTIQNFTNLTTQNISIIGKKEAPY